MRQVVILAGGKGTRLQARIGRLPKSMVNIGGKPLLEHHILLARSHGFSEIALLVSYGAATIRDYFQDGTKWGVNLRYIEDVVPRGTAGAVLDALDKLCDRFIVMYGDTMLNVDLGRFYEAHDRHGAGATLFLHPNDHPYDSDLVDVDGQGRIIAFHPYPHNPDHYYPNLVNAALYVIEKTVMIPYKTFGGIVDFGRNLFPRMLREDKYLYGYRSPEYIKDIGTPERLDKVDADFRSGYIASRSLATAAPAIFLDRDGTLNVEANHIGNVKDFELIEGIPDAVRRLNHSVYRTVIVTNQPVLARGECSESDLKQIHNKLATLLGSKAAYVDAIYYCPHHPHCGFAGERKELKKQCSCRKPEPGLIYLAADNLNIDLSRSWLIGDSTVDIMTAQNAGLKSILVRTGYAGLDNRYPVGADFKFDTLRDSVEFILEIYPRMRERAKDIIRDVIPGDRIIIGGPRHSGKSTWASVLRYAFTERGQKASIIPLDNWEKGGADGDMETLTSRDDVAAIKQPISHLHVRPERADFVVPHHDRANRVLIFEGVAGLCVENLLRTARKRIFVDSSETRRKEAFWKEYQFRGSGEESIATACREQEIKETPQVLASRSRADVVLEGLW